MGSLEEGGKGRTMRKEYINGSITIRDLRKLLNTIREITGTAVSVEADLWNHNPGADEKIAVFISGAGGHKFFRTLKQAWKYVEELRKEKENGSS